MDLFYDAQKLALQKQEKLTTLALQCQCLQEVDLTDCESLTNSICEVFSDGGGCPMLKSLVLDNCEVCESLFFFCSIYNFVKFAYTWHIHDEEPWCFDMILLLLSLAYFILFGVVIHIKLMVDNGVIVLELLFCCPLSMLSKSIYSFWYCLAISLVMHHILRWKDFRKLDTSAMPKVQNRDQLDS